MLLRAENFFMEAARFRPLITGLGYPQTIKVAVVQATGFNDDYGMLNKDLVINGYWDLQPTAYNH